ncbi:MAG: response regulator, partial [Planctomycetes bacterium]|nr:response regulator [Planctomycetota bacterium]
MADGVDGGSSWGLGASTAARILVLEDDPDTGRGFELCLAAIGHELHRVRDGREGIAVAATLRPDLVLLDLGLPGVGGMDVLRRLRIVVPEAKVIVLSAWDAALFEAAALEAGASLYLEKPITAESLAQAVEGLL